MNTPVNILAIVGSYRKGGIIERAVDEILASTREAGAVTRKITLLDKHLAFCTNCRSCTQVAGDNYGSVSLMMIWAASCRRLNGLTPLFLRHR